MRLRSQPGVKSPAGLSGGSRVPQGKVKGLKCPTMVSEVGQ